MDLMTFLIRIILTASQMGYPWEPPSEDLQIIGGRTSDLKGADWTQNPPHPTPFPAPSPSPFPVFTPTMPNSQKRASLLTPAHLRFFLFPLPSLTTFAQKLYFGHLMRRADSWERPERLKAGGERDDRGWDGWMAPPTQWTWIGASFRRWWRMGKPGMLQLKGSQRDTPEWLKNNNNNDAKYALNLALQSSFLYHLAAFKLLNMPQTFFCLFSLLYLFRMHWNTVTAQHFIPSCFSLHSLPSL